MIWRSAMNSVRGAVNSISLPKLTKIHSQKNGYFHHTFLLFMASSGALFYSSSPAESYWFPFSRNSKSPFEYPELSSGIERRKKAEVKLENFINEMRERVRFLSKEMNEGKMSNSEYSKQMSALKAEIDLTTQRITYGVEAPGKRASYEREYGCTHWTENALKTALKYSPLVEIGAGRGNWQRALSNFGADIVAYDNGCSPHPCSNLPPVGNISFGDESSILKHSDRTLILVYPPPGDMALRCLDNYKGDVLIYVGEGRGGVNASNEFFDMLTNVWQVEEIVMVDPFPECFERMFVLRRRKKIDTPH